MRQVFLLILLLSCFANVMACDDESLSDKQNFDKCLIDAEQGLVYAQNNLGFKYQLGQGVTQDYVMAHVWWNIAGSTGQKGAVKNRDIVCEKND